MARHPLAHRPNCPCLSTTQCLVAFWSPNVHIPLVALVCGANPFVAAPASRSACNSVKPQFVVATRHWSRDRVMSDSEEEVLPAQRAGRPPACSRLNGGCEGEQLAR